MAAAFLMERGYRILERNWHCPMGEIDIIARDGNELVFVEAKSRTSDLFGTPETSVNVRFDIVAVTFQECAPRIELTRNAFELA